MNTSLVGIVFQFRIKLKLSTFRRKLLSMAFKLCCWGNMLSVPYSLLAHFNGCCVRKTWAGLADFTFGEKHALSVSEGITFEKGAKKKHVALLH